MKLQNLMKLAKTEQKQNYSLVPIYTEPTIFGDHVRRNFQFACHYLEIFQEKSAVGKIEGERERKSGWKSGENFSKKKVNKTLVKLLGSMTFLEPFLPVFKFICQF